MAHIDFIQDIHQKTKRDYLARVNAYPKALAAKRAKKFDFDYWDGDRKFGYGGYKYDGRWKILAKRLIKHYQLDATGWATPFLMVPEVVNIDPENLQKLLKAKVGDVVLNASSPLGVPFWNLITSVSEYARRERIAKGRPGAPCMKGYAKINTEFTKEPICVASYQYQKLKLSQLPESAKALRDQVLCKSCLCHDLAGCATRQLGIDRQAKPAICPGPNILNFSKVAKLEEMVGHIYGRLSLLTNVKRSHMFLNELKLHIDFLKDEIKKSAQGLAARSTKKLQFAKDNLYQGIEYYQKLARTHFTKQKNKFLHELNQLKDMLDHVVLDVV